MQITSTCYLESIIHSETFGNRSEIIAIYKTDTSDDFDKSLLSSHKTVSMDGNSPDQSTRRETFGSFLEYSKYYLYVTSTIFMSSRTSLSMVERDIGVPEINSAKSWKLLSVLDNTLPGAHKSKSWPSLYSNHRTKQFK